MENTCNEGTNVTLEYLGIMENMIMTEPMMTATEAKECIDQINDNLRDTRELLLDLYEREGWKALGYGSWRECVTGEFQQSEAYLYRQLVAAKAERNISPLGEIGIIPERQLRPLTSLPPDQQREVYKKAIKTAPANKLTAKHVERTVKEMQEETPEKKVDTHKNISLETEIISDEFQSAYDDMLHEIMKARVMQWKTTSHEVAIGRMENLLAIANNK